MDRASGQAPSRKVQHAALTALLLTLLFFTFEQTGLFQAYDSSANDQSFQDLHAGLFTLKRLFSDIPDVDTSVPLVILFSDNATALDQYGWPLRMVDLLELLEELKDAEAAAVYVDIVIRSADHDPVGFCHLINQLDRFNGGSELVQKVPAVSASGALSGQCLDNLKDLKHYAEHKAADPSDKWHYYGRDGSGGSSTRMIFAAPLDYLRARDGYYKARREAAGCTPANAKKCSDARQKKSDRLHTFQREIDQWPGVAYLDQVSLLAPLAISAEDGRSNYLWVDEGNFYSPALLMGCLKGARGDGAERCAPDGEARFHDSSNYLVWGLSRDGWKSLGAKDYKTYMAQYKSCAESDSWGLQALQQFFSALTPMVGEFLSRCPYYPTIDMFYYATGSLRIGDVAAGRNVLVGTDMHRFNDFTLSPVNGQVAGVYAHAVSLDNLIQGEIYQPADDASDMGRWVSQVFLQSKSFIFFMLCFGLLLSKNWIRALIEPHRILLTNIFVWFIAAAVIWIVYEFFSNGRNVFQLAAALMLLGGALCLIAIAYMTTWFRLLPIGEKYRACAWRWLRSRRYGMHLFMPHFFLIIVGIVVLNIVTFLVAQAANLVPADVAGVILAQGPIWLTVSREDVGEGFALFFGNRDVAEAFG